ncbi:helix-turn-helix domain-containing protein [Streptomyces sp. DT24]|uniref:helix-turn-helix domain-containing protein n=1 Tax=unclassified Streptomyces TaxID=2593676 RepID=UPI0023B95C49|nr:helix-turn-helix transcriptional regulator [Streptomyces sp. AM 4-1-1]WEH34706.1 helix-turn-helix transcriptional regulator [Streptomyces sp. AM 4-1-1]
MTETTTGSTVPRRQLGRHLRDLRNQARITVRAAAKHLEWSEPKIWRIETGQTSLRSLDVEAMCRVYGAPGELTQALMGLAKETKGRGWWHSYGDVIPEGFDLYIGLEEAAQQLSWYESELVPGLLQTADYARTLIQADNPGVDDEEIQRRVHVRIQRQTLLTRATAAPKVDVALNEAVLRRPVGGDKVMVNQLERLVHLNNLDNVSIRVVPFSAGLHAGIMSGPFVTMRFPSTGDGRNTEPPTVYVEGFTGALYLDKPNEIERYDVAFTSIRGSALDEAGSTSLLKQAARELSK